MCQRRNIGNAVPAIHFLEVGRPDFSVCGSTLLNTEDAQRKCPENGQQDRGGDEGGGGGWDTSSDEGRGVGAGGFRDFERSTAESTRMALVESDLLLCKADDSNTERQDNPEDDSSTTTNDKYRDKDNNCDSSPNAMVMPRHRHDQQQNQEQRQQQRRFVPGDPFANEEADIGAWADHFTYLSVVPAASWTPTMTTEPTTTGTAAVGTVSLVEHGRNNEGPRWQDECCDAPPIGGVSSCSPGSASGNSAYCVLPQGASVARGDGGNVIGNVLVAGEVVGGGDDPVVVGRAVRRGHENEEEQIGELEAEGVLASHGVYEEYLAYDCRPPSPSTSENNGDENNAVQSNISGAGGNEGAGGLLLTANAKTKRSQNYDQSADTNLVDPEEREEVRKQSLLFSPQQREVREEMMDRLFHEIWRRITPDLLAAAENSNSSNARVVKTG